MPNGLFDLMKQWVAVNTWRLVIKVPPQRFTKAPLVNRTPTEANQGYSPVLVKKKRLYILFLTS